MVLKTLTTHSLKSSAAQNWPQNMGLQLAAPGQGKHSEVPEGFP